MWALAKVSIDLAQIPGMAKKHNASLSFIFITILVDIIGIGIIVPVIPDLISNLTGETINEASRYGGFLMLAYAAMQFLFAPILGELSDKYGRRPVLLLALFGLGVDYLFHAFAPTIGWLFVGRILAGISGGSITVATSYIADISTPEKKAQNFGLIGAAFGLGFIVGPFIGGVFAQYGLQVPFFIAAGLSFANLIYGYFVLPESLAKENRRDYQWSRAVPGGSLIHLRKYPLIIGLIVSFFLVYFASQAVQSTWSFYTIYRFDWNPAQVGYSLAAVGIVVAIVQGGLIRIVVKKFGEKKTIILGMIFWTVGLSLFAVASEGWMMYAFIIPYCLGGIAGPTLQSVISNQVASNEQGELQGALTSLMSLSTIIGPPVMTGLFYYFTKDAISEYFFPGASFALASFTVLISLLLIIKPLNKLKESLSRPKS